MYQGEAVTCTKAPDFGKGMVIKMEKQEKQENDILVVEGLNVSYGKRAGKYAGSGKTAPTLRNVSFRMKKGEILGLVGESGCGKTTLVKAVLGMIKTDSGNISHYSPHPQMIFQDPYGSLNPAKKIGWILEEPLRIRGGCDRRERHERVRQMLKQVGLDEKFAERYPEQLSGGQRQRVSIASALMLNPELLIADEPVSALDVTIQAQIMELLMRLHKQMGLSILFISHDLRVVYRMCENVMIMKAGEIIEKGDMDSVYFAPKQEYTKELLRSAGIMEG